MRLFNVKTSWESVRASTRFTASYCEAQAPHAALAEPLRALLAQWTDLDRARIEANDALAGANALVAAADAALDACVIELDNRVLYEHRGDVGHPAYKEYFPERTSSIVRMALQAEIARTRMFVHVAEERGASAEVQAILQRMGDVERSGEEALYRRRDAQDAVRRVALRMAAWKSDANIARRKVHAALDAHAVQHGLPRAYASRFFPAVPRLSKARSLEPPATPE